jgi:hypothetical protein
MTCSYLAVGVSSWNCEKCNSATKGYYHMSKTKDYSVAIAGIAEMDIEKLHELYSDMLATAHDIGFKVPDDQLVETDDPDVLRALVPKLHDGIVGHVKDAGETDSPSAGKKPAKKSKPKADKTKQPEASGPRAEVDKEKTMKTSAKKATVAKKAATKKTAAKGKKANANARTPVSRSKYSEKATIKVVAKENPTRKGTGRFERVANLLKSDGKLVSDFLKKGGRSGTLSYAVEQGWVKVVG